MEPLAESDEQHVSNISADVQLVEAGSSQALLVLNYKFEFDARRLLQCQSVVVLPVVRPIIVST